MENLPLGTYYNSSGVLMNNSRNKKDLEKRVLVLEKEIETLYEKLNKCQIQLQSILSSPS